MPWVFDVNGKPVWKSSERGFDYDPKSGKWIIDLDVADPVCRKVNREVAEWAGLIDDD